MKKKLLLSTIIPLLLSSCVNKPIKDAVIFESKNEVSINFNGLGVEWGVYEDTNKLAKDYWERTIKIVDRLNPSLVRCMTNFDWIVKNFDNKGTSDTSDDTWEYDFKNKYMQNACDILDYCETHNIDVAFGVWNVIGSPSDENDEWGMIKNATSDERWAKLSADLMEYLIKFKGYTCIKWFVSTNEPNWTGLVGQSKNAYNTYEKWEQGVKNVRREFNKIGLNDLDIIGGDTTGFNGSKEYLTNIATNLKDVLNNYGIHLYISNFDIDNGTLGSNIKKLYDGIKEIDNSLGENKDLMIWEAGLLDGKNVLTDCNAYIGNYSYGIRMADYTIQSILNGVNGIVYWDLDDAMHFMYSETGSNPKEWGMFSTLNEANASKQELRPWYHSSTLLSNLFKKGSRIISATSEENEKVRVVGSLFDNDNNAGFAFLNRDTKEMEKTFVFEDKINNKENKIYVYLFNESSLRLDNNGFIVPSYIINGSLNNKTTLKIPASSMLVASSRRL